MRVGAQHVKGRSTASGTSLPAQKPGRQQTENIREAGTTHETAIRVGFHPAAMNLSPMGITAKLPNQEQIAHDPRASFTCFRKRRDAYSFDWHMHVEVELMQEQMQRHLDEWQRRQQRLMQALA